MPAMHRNSRYWSISVKEATSSSAVLRGCSANVCASRRALKRHALTTSQNSRSPCRHKSFKASDESHRKAVRPSSASVLSTGIPRAPPAIRQVYEVIVDVRHRVAMRAEPRKAFLVDERFEPVRWWVHCESVMGDETAYKQARQPIATNPRLWFSTPDEKTLGVRRGQCADSAAEAYEEESIVQFPQPISADCQCSRIEGRDEDVQPQVELVPVEKHGIGYIPLHHDLGIVERKSMKR